MKISNKSLGVTAMVIAPAFLIQTILDIKLGAGNSRIGGIADLIYMIGWMCSVIALKRLCAAGYSKPGKAILIVQFIFLCIANIWNILVAFDPKNDTFLFHVLDICWPLSNLCYLVTGIIVAVKNILKGLHRYIVLIAVFWLPVSLVCLQLFGRNNLVMYFSGIYSLIAWFSIGYIIYSTGKKIYKDMKPAVYPLLSMQ